MIKHYKRRSILKLGALTGLASASVTTISSTHASTEQAQQPFVEPLIKKYVRLGRTGLKISDISFGSSQLRSGEEHLVRHALERGINYFDTAETYTRGDSETVLGNALKGRRKAYCKDSGGFVDCAVYDRYRLRAGHRIDGPAIIEERESTAVVGPNDAAEVDGFLNLVIDIG